MNVAVTSKEEILRNACAIVEKEGLPGLSMRRVAESCGVALGSLYNYFDSKDALLAATVESVWRDIFPPRAEGEASLSFREFVAALYYQAQTGARRYPGFFRGHAFVFAGTAKLNAQAVMNRTLDAFKRRLLARLNADPEVRAGNFSASFTREAFVEFVFDSFLFTLSQGKPVQVLLDVITRTIYR